MDRVNYLRYARLLWAARHYYFVDIIWMDSERVTIYRFFTVIHAGMEWELGSILKHDRKLVGIYQVGLIMKYGWRESQIEM